MCREYFELLKEWKFKINMSRVAQKDETLIEAKYGETHNERHTQLAIFGCKMRCSQNLLDVALATPPGGPRLIFRSKLTSLTAPFIMRFSIA